jgi:hypothetical protein
VIEYVRCIKAHEGSNFTVGKEYAIADAYNYGITDDIGNSRKLYEMNDGSGKSCIGSVIFIDLQNVA